MAWKTYGEPNAQAEASTREQAASAASAQELVIRWLAEHFGFGELKLARFNAERGETYEVSRGIHRALFDSAPIYNLGAGRIMRVTSSDEAYVVGGDMLPSTPRLDRVWS